MSSPLPKISVPNPEAWRHVIADASDPLEIAARILEAGWVALLPTDTVYGLACRPDRTEAAERIFLLKGRPRSTLLPILAGSEETANQLGIRHTKASDRLLRSDFVPGALTIVFDVDPALAPAWLDPSRGIAIRFPDHDIVRTILDRTGPLCATSANAHGKPTPETVDEILAQLDGMPDVVLDGGTVGVVPSTIVNCRQDPPTIERQWAVPASEIDLILR